MQIHNTGSSDQYIAKELFDDRMKCSYPNDLSGLVKGMLEDTQSEVVVVPLLALMHAIASNHPNHFTTVFTVSSGFSTFLWFRVSSNYFLVSKNAILKWSYLKENIRVPPKYQFPPKNTKCSNKITNYLLGSGLL